MQFHTPRFDKQNKSVASGQLSGQIRNDPTTTLVDAQSEYFDMAYCAVGQEIAYDEESEMELGLHENLEDSYIGENVDHLLKLLTDSTSSSYHDEDSFVLFEHSTPNTKKQLRLLSDYFERCLCSIETQLDTAKSELGQKAIDCGLEFHLDDNLFELSMVNGSGFGYENDLALRLTPLDFDQVYQLEFNTLKKDERLLAEKYLNILSCVGYFTDVTHFMEVETEIDNELDCLNEQDFTTLKGLWESEKHNYDNDEKILETINTISESLHEHLTDYFGEDGLEVLLELMNAIERREFVEKSTALSPTIDFYKLTVTERVADLKKCLADANAKSTVLQHIELGLKFLETNLNVDSALNQCADEVGSDLPLEMGVFVIKNDSDPERYACEDIVNQQYECGETPAIALKFDDNYLMPKLKNVMLGNALLGALAKVC